MSVLIEQRGKGGFMRGGGGRGGGGGGRRHGASGEGVARFFLFGAELPTQEEELFRTFRVPHYNQGSYQNLTVVGMEGRNP